MLTIPPIFPVAIEIAFNTMLIISKIMVTVHAHPSPFNSPYATMNDAIPIAINTPPIAMATPPKNEGGIPERGKPEPVKVSSIVKFPFWKAEGGREGRIIPAARRVTPPKSIKTPPIMLRIAIIVTPVGRDFGVACKILYRKIRLGRIY